MGIHLSKTQQMIVNHNEGALLVVAGPGSGKTRVLIERVRRLLSESKGHFRILALTFTNKAANEMKERLEEFPDIDKRAFIGTLHSFCVEVLANRGKSVGIDELPHIFESYQDRKHVLIKAVMDDPELSHALKTAGNAKEQDDLINRWLKMICEAKNNLLLPEMKTNLVESKVYSAYNEGLKASNAVDFDDLLLLTYRLFIERPKIADFYRRQYRYICIDEAQDLNEAQYQVIRALCASSYNNIMMVGDPKQAIYVWNGAHPKYMDMFERDFSAKKITMNENFRSSKAVVDAARVLSPDYDVSGQLPIEGEITLIVGENECEEASLVIDYIKNLLENGHKDIDGKIEIEQCALIGRNRYVFSAIENQLKKLGCPYYKKLSADHESESDILQDFELCLRLLANPRDKLHYDLLLNRWEVRPRESFIEVRSGIDLLHSLKRQLKKKKKNFKIVLEAIDKMNWSEYDFQFSHAMDHMESYANSLSSKDDKTKALIIEDINVWRRHWDSYLRSERGGKHTITSFLGKVALGTTQQPHEDGLAVLTLHSAKGLEFDVVVVMGMTEGTFPDYRAKKNQDSMEEERRNAFVAVTRSKRLLAFSYPRKKMMPWGAEKRQQSSRYLRELQQNGVI